MQADEVKVSVVIPVYNSGKVLERTVDSVLKQTFKDFELILIDDGSTDQATVKLVDELGGLDARIRVIHQQNKGLCTTCDVGVDNARAKYVYIVDQDDLVHPQLLETAFGICENHQLDYLGLRWQNSDIKATPECPLYSKEEIKFAVVDNSSGDATDFCRSIGKIHIDAWAQFQTRELARKYPFETFGRSGRTFKCVYASKRWGVVDNVLYYYSINNDSSIMHKALHVDWVDEMHTEFDNIYDITYRDKTDTVGREKFEAMCKCHLSAGLRTLFHMIKRAARYGKWADRIKLWRSFSAIAVDFLFVRKIPCRYLGVKHYMEYLAVALIYGGFFARRDRAKTFRGSSKTIA